MPVRPKITFMLSHPAHAIALGFGTGLSPKAPGTVGSLLAWLSWLLLAPHLSTIEQGILLAAALLLGWWACKTTAEHLGTPDPCAVVWDEIVAMWCILWWLMPTGLGWQLIAFSLFRFFDVVKPGPVGWADSVCKGQGWRGAWGILFDDLMAAFCTVLTIALWQVL